MAQASPRLKNRPTAILPTAALALAALAWIQPSWAGAASPTPPGGGIPLPGRVVDLTRDAQGLLTYATEEGELGQLLGGAAQALPGVGPFAEELVAVHAGPTGDWWVLDALGDLHRVPAAGGAAAQIYDDLYLINQPTDLLVDTAGDALIAGRTISSGTRAVMRVSTDGERWMYYTTDIAPLGLAVEVNGTSIAVTTTSGGLLELWDEDGIPRFSEFATGAAGHVEDLDGDLACGTDGTRWWSAGNEVWKLASGSSVPQLELDAGAPVRALSLANSSSGSGTSLYYATDLGTSSEIHELGVSTAATPLLASSFGEVPGRGIFRLFHSSMNAFCLTSDANGDLLLGGDEWGADAEVRRIDLPELTTQRLTSPSDGVGLRVEGLVLQPDGSALILERSGQVSRLDLSSGTPQVAPVWTESGDPIVTAKGLAAGRQGQLWVAQRTAFDSGSVQALQADGSTVVLAATEDSRGLAAHPFGPELLSSTWKDAGFNGTVGSLDPDMPSGNPPEVLPGFGEVNYSNGANWGDGDVLVDAAGRIYTLSEDDFSVYRYDPFAQGKARLGSGYLNRPAGLAIAPSLPDSNSTTGFSLFVTEWNRLWEIPGVPPAAPRLLDPQAPRAGSLRGFSHPDWGVPVALAHDSQGALHGITESGHLLRFDGHSLATLLAGPLQGLPTGWVSLDIDASDRFVGVLADGRIVRVDSATAFGTEVLFDDPDDQLSAVIAGGLQDSSEPYTLTLLEAAGAGEARARLWQLSLEVGSPTPLADTARGRALARSVGHGAWLVLEAGRLGERGGLLAVDETLGRSGHLRGVQSEEGDWRFDQVRGGGLACAPDGRVWCAEGGQGRVWRLDPNTDERVLFAGNYDAPGAMHLAPGTPGTAGPRGDSLFLVDGFAVFEHGVDADLDAQVALPFPAEFTAPARPTLGSFVELAIQAPEHANRAYIAFAGTSGKEPGFDLVLLGNPFETRSVPLNFDSLWGQQLGAPFSGFLGVLDAQGQGSQPIGIDLPNDPFLASLGVFADLVWLPLDPLSPSAIADVGGSCQIHLGQP